MGCGQREIWWQKGQRDAMWELNLPLLTVMLEEGDHNRKMLTVSKVGRQGIGLSPRGSKDKGSLWLHLDLSPVRSVLNFQATEREHEKLVLF